MRHPAQFLEQPRIVRPRMPRRVEHLIVERTHRITAKQASLERWHGHRRHRENTAAGAAGRCTYLMNTMYRKFPAPACYAFCSRRGRAPVIRAGKITSAA